jgi:hypothetical protein
MENENISKRGLLKGHQPDHGAKAKRSSVAVDVRVMASGRGLARGVEHATVKNKKRPLGIPGGLLGIIFPTGDYTSMISFSLAASKSSEDLM